MALGALSLSTTSGVQGRPFQATINGLTTGRVEVLVDGSPGFSTFNGKVRSEGLPYPVSTVVLREYEPGVGAGFRDTRIDITAATPTQTSAIAIASMGGGRTLIGYRVAGDIQPDGSYAYNVYAVDDLGATIKTSATGGAPTPTPGAGSQPTSIAAMGITPTGQIHVNTSTITLFPQGTFQGYMTAGSDILYVTSIDAVNCPALKEDTLIGSASVPGVTMIRRAVTENNPSDPNPVLRPGGGGVGCYHTDFAPAGNIGSSGSPVAFTNNDLFVQKIDDILGNPNMSLTCPSASRAPQLCTDATGVKFLRFRSQDTDPGFMHNLTITGLDSATMSIITVERFKEACRHAAASDQTRNVYTIGAQALGNGGSTAVYTFMTMANGTHSKAVGTWYTDPNFKHHFVGSRKKVVSRHVVAADGLNGGNNTQANRLTIQYVNEYPLNYGSTDGGSSRLTNHQGFSVNSNSTTADGANGTLRDVYEMIFCFTGQMGSQAQLPARSLQVQTACMTNHGIVSITKRVVGLGTSVDANHSTSGGSGYTSNGTGMTTFNYMTDPGGANALPADTDVCNWAVPGGGVAHAWCFLNSTGGGHLTANTPSPLATMHMLPGGSAANFVASDFGPNEGDGSQWPVSSWAAPGVAARDTIALGEDIYGGTYNCTFNVTIAAGAKLMNLASVTGVIAKGSLLTGTGLVTTAPVIFNPISFDPQVDGAVTAMNGFNYQAATTGALTGVACTGQLRGYRYFISELLTRGFRVHFFKCAWNFQDLNTEPTRKGLWDKIDSSLLTDCDAQPGGAYAGKLTISDLSPILYNGGYPFGVNFVIKNDFCNDTIHPTLLANRVKTSGGSTPTLGMFAKINAMVLGA